MSSHISPKAYVRWFIVLGCSAWYLLGPSALDLHRVGFAISTSKLIVLCRMGNVSACKEANGYFFEYAKLREEVFSFAYWFILPIFMFLLVLAFFLAAKLLTGSRPALVK